MAMAVSSRKPGNWARQSARRDVFVWYRRHWVTFPVLAGCLAVVVVVNRLSGLAPFMAGLYDGIVGTVLVGAMLLGGVVGSGSHFRLLGVAGESFTAEEFTRRKRRRQGWRVFNGLTINRHEIDHVAIGPGGVLAIETKFVGTGRWRVTEHGIEGALCDPLTQTRISRDKASSILLSLRRSVPAIADVPVLPVLIVWGPGCPILEHGYAHLDGVHIFSGQHERSWRQWLDTPRLNLTLAHTLGTAFETFDAAHTPTAVRSH